MNKLVGEAATLEIAAKFASQCAPPLIVYLQGDLGAGKTTFARGLITALGHTGTVKSPTFTLVETYHLNKVRLYHFDLYRLNDPQELEYIGLRELVGEDDIICLIEWPDKGGNEVPAADLVIQLEYQGDSRTLESYAETKKGQSIIDNL